MNDDDLKIVRKGETLILRSTKATFYLKADHIPKLISALKELYHG